MTRRRKSDVKSTEKLPAKATPPSAVRKSSRQMAKKQLEGEMVNGGEVSETVPQNIVIDSKKEAQENKKNVTKKGTRGRRPLNGKKSKAEEAVTTSNVIEECSFSEKIETNSCDSQEVETTVVNFNPDDLAKDFVPPFPSQGSLCEETIIEETIICEVEEMEVETADEKQEIIMEIMEDTENVFVDDKSEAANKLITVDRTNQVPTKEEDTTMVLESDDDIYKKDEAKKLIQDMKMKKVATKLREFSLFDGEEFNAVEKRNIVRRKPKVDSRVLAQDSKDIPKTTLESTDVKTGFMDGADYVISVEKQIALQMAQNMNLTESDSGGLLPINKMECLILNDADSTTRINPVKEEIAETKVTRDYESNVSLQDTSNILKTERLQNIEEHSRDSELDVKLEFDDVKISSGSENSNDTLVSMSSCKVSDCNLDSKGSINYLNDSDKSRDTTSESGSNGSSVRRSSRIRSIGLMNRRSHGRGLVNKPLMDSPKVPPPSQPEKFASAPPTPIELRDTSSTEVSEIQSDKENSNSKLTTSSTDSLTPPITISATSGYDSDSSKPVKVKSRWRRSSELEMGNSSNSITNTRTTSSIFTCTTIPEVTTFEGTINTGVLTQAMDLSDKTKTFPETENMPSGIVPEIITPSESIPSIIACSIYSTSSAQETIGSKISLPMVGERDREMEERLSQFEHLKENLYLTERYTNKEHKRMVCDCFLTEEEIERGELGCGEDCLNRLLMIECGLRCVVGDRCTNKRFQNCDYAKCEVFRTEKKGFGLRATVDLHAGDFIMEYVGEVVDPKDFRRRAKEYSKDKNRHYYFMALKSDQIIDATMKGNVSRFINHSCDPNAETQKWTVNGELRIGFFNKKFIAAGEEITFDYHFQRYGKEAQKCFCEAINCRGWIGETPKKKEFVESEDDDDDDEMEEEEEEEEEEESQQQTETGELSEAGEVDKPKELIEKSPKVEKKVKRQRRTLKKKKEEKKPADYMEDEDLEEEIDKLCAGGLKNRTHTLMLSRLMVRSREVEHRTRLLRVIQSGEQPCRRLFLDYHGLRLIWSYMMDLTDNNNSEKNDQFRFEILKTLKTLPIPNKTMLMDSKVFKVVEKWSKSLYSSPNDSPEDDQSKQKSINDEMESNGDSNEKISTEKITSDDNKEIDGEVKQESNQTIISELAGSLLSEWSSLKEVFRIPKKERIEQMKEHEREADRGYREELEKEERRKTFSYERHRLDRHHRSDSDKRLDRRRGRESPDSEHSSRVKEKRIENERTNLVPVRRMTKYERRQLFAMKVAKEEEEKQRRQQQELWQEHEARCLALGIDPHTTAVIDPQSGFPLYFNQSLGQWQPYPIQENPEIPQPGPMAYMAGTPQVMAVHPPLPPNAHPPLPPNTPMAQTLPPNAHPPLPLPTTHPPLPQPNHPPLPQAQVYAINPAYAAAPQTVYPHQYPEGTPLPMPNNLVQMHNGTPIAPQNLYVEAPPPTSEISYPVTSEMSEMVISETPSIELTPILDLPPKWKWAKDDRGRTYYYHIKDRISQWLPPAPDHIGVPADSSSSEESSEETSSSNEEEDEDDDMISEDKDPDQTLDDLELESTLSDGISGTKQRKIDLFGDGDVMLVDTKKRRDGLVQERIISPRRDENRVDHRKYKEYKEKLKRQKERAKLKEHLKKSRKHRRSNKSESHARYASSKLQAAKSELALSNERKIKDAFRINMANVMVHFLNPYRKNDCKQGRITNTEDFKHLARKLTHFVLAKELKHCRSVDDLQCNDNVKHKAKDFVRKYMSKFGPIYQKSTDED